MVRALTMIRSVRLSAVASSSFGISVVARQHLGVVVGVSPRDVAASSCRNEFVNSRGVRSRSPAWHVHEAGIAIERRGKKSGRGKAGGRAALLGLCMRAGHSGHVCGGLHCLH